MTSSPFPGMDPYLERHWRDVHVSLVVLAKMALQPQLPEELVARNNERLVIDDVDSELAKERFVEIIDVSAGGRVVTVTEFVSPTNKRSRNGRGQYRQKQYECLNASVSLVEVDLARGGERRLLVPEECLPAEARTTYLACTYRAKRHDGTVAGGEFELYGLPLRERLPAIRIPLRERDPDAVLDLQSLVDRAYEAGAYGRGIDYTQPCVPPLTGEDERWAAELLKSASAR